MMLELVVGWVDAMPLGGSRADFYMAKAKELRETARKCRDATIKEQLLRVADEYEALAKTVQGGVLSI
jgi:hypothetical protein